MYLFLYIRVPICIYIFIYINAYNSPLMDRVRRRMRDACTISFNGSEINIAAGGYHLVVVVVVYG